jgi:hypothetical protein
VPPPRFPGSQQTRPFFFPIPAQADGQADERQRETESKREMGGPGRTRTFLPRPLAIFQWTAIELGTRRNSPRSRLFYCPPKNQWLRLEKSDRGQTRSVRGSKSFGSSSMSLREIRAGIFIYLRKADRFTIGTRGLNRSGPGFSSTYSYFHHPRRGSLSLSL